MIDNEIHTTIEESEMLLELGVSPETASYQIKDGVFSENKEEGIPVWSNYDLMLLIPEEVMYKGNYLSLNLTLYSVEYSCWYNYSEELDFLFCKDRQKDNIIDCIKWLRENNLLLKNEDKNEKNGIAMFFAVLGGAKLF